jgi:acyl-coenzyme A thioesterase PaaI-like protein
MSTANVPQASIDHFTSIPWTKAWLDDPAYKLIPLFSRHLKDETGEDFFFSRTINTSDTIPHMISLERKDLKLPSTTSSSSKSNPSASRAGATFTAPEQPDLIILTQLGSPGLDGHPSVIHGGITCAILDETQSDVVTLHRLLLPESEFGGSLFTVNLDVSFKAPVQTPGTVLIRCWLVAKERRKWITRGQVVDQNGTVLAQAEAIWVGVPAKL